MPHVTAALILAIAGVAGVPADAYADTVPAVFSGVVGDQHGSVGAGIAVQLMAPAGCGGTSGVRSVTGADGSFSLSVTPGTYDLLLSMPSRQNPQYPWFSVCTTGITVNGDLVQNLVVPVNYLTVHAQDSAGNPVAGATVDRPGFTYAASFELFPGATTASASQNLVTSSVVTDAAGNATLPLLPLGEQYATSTIVHPPAGSALSPTTVATGAMQTNTTVTAMMAGTVNEPTTTTVNSSANPSVQGQGVTFTATVTGGGTPSGSVTFTVDGLAKPPVTIVSGSAILPPSALPAGSHTVTATYAGDSFHLGSTSPTITQVVNRAATTTTLTSAVNPSLAGQPGSVTATVAAVAPGTGTPTGSVTFTVDGNQTSAPLVAGSAALDLSTLGAGSHVITAAYSGDTGYTASESTALTQLINPLATVLSLASSPNPSVTGQTVTVTASVTAPVVGRDAPTGTITFTIDGQASTPFPVPATGVAELPLAALTTGTHTIIATYSGDALYAASASAPLTHTVNPAATSITLTSSANPISVGAPATITATVTTSAPGAGTPTGSLTFVINGTAIDPVPLTAGVASLDLSTLPAGTHAITATYPGSAAYLASTSLELSQLIQQPTTTTITASPANTAVQGTTVNLTATQAPATSGTVQFFDGTTALGQPIAVNGGTASFSTSSLAVGPHSLSAVFTPAASPFTGSTSTPIAFQITASTIAIDRTITANGNSTVTTAAFSTTGPRLLVAFTSSDGPTTKQTTTVTGAGLTWSLVKRANSKGGTSEIWTAQASGALTNATITSTPKTTGYDQSLTVLAFTGASGIGASASAGKNTGAPTVALTTTQPGSWVFGVGNDDTGATARTVGANQALLNQWIDTNHGKTFWVQNQLATTPNAGTVITINDTAPTTHVWNLAAVEITPTTP